MTKIEIKFQSQPAKNINIQYKCDERKDKCISGTKTKYPTVKINGPINSSGFLKVVTVSHNTDYNGLYSLHPNLLINDRKGTKFCDDFGVATFPFNISRNGEALIEMKNLCIRHAKKDDVKIIKQNWEENCQMRFDPYGTGYSFEKFDLQRLRLCCEAFISGFTSTTTVSDTIVNGQSDIKIEYWQEDIEASVDGGDKLHLFIRKLTVDQKEIFAKFSDNEDWESDFVEPLYKHHEVALVFQIPPYKTIDISKPIECKFQLLVQGKEYFSEVKTFKYIPNKIAIKRAMQEAFVNDDDFDLIEHKKTKNNLVVDSASASPDFSGSELTDEEPNLMAGRVEACFNLFETHYIPNSLATSTSFDIFGDINFDEFI